jgi:predicted extracellular nuclease
MRLIRILVALSVLVGALACEPPVSSNSDAGPDADVVDAVEAPTTRIATFNVRRLFDRTCDTGRCGDDEFEEVPSEQEYDLILQRTAEAIAGFDADIILLQEIENAAVLDDLRSRLAPEYNVGVIGETGFNASLDVAVISRGELLGTKQYRDARRLELPNGAQSEFTREFLQVDLQLEGEDIIVFAAHFKSQSNDDPERRLAEAQEAREIVDEVAAANPEAMVVLGGDLNDTPDSDPLQALLTNGGLQRAGSELPNDQLWTYNYQGNRQAIDHLLIAPTDGGAYVEQSAMVVRDASGNGLADSDHAALYADFELY